MLALVGETPQASTEGHPADLPVELRAIDLPDGAPRRVIALEGARERSTSRAGSWTGGLAYVSYSG
jgi:hypothetical protein